MTTEINFGEKEQVVKSAKRPPSESEFKSSLLNYKTAGKYFSGFDIVNGLKLLC